MRKAKNRWKSARTKGYNLERDCVLNLRAQGVFAIRINSRSQKGNLRPIDVVAAPRNGPPEFIQCKRHKKYLGKEEIERLKLVCTQYGARPFLCYRNRGLVFEPIPFP